MEATRQSMELVHVLRHSFRPSEQLGTALESFLPPESARPKASFEIKSLGMISLDAYRHANHEFSLQLIEARKAFEKSQAQSFVITPDVKIRKVGEKAIDVLMGVQDVYGLYSLTRATRQRLPEGTLLRDMPGPEFSVYARINSSVPITEEFQIEALEQYNDAYQNLGPKNLMKITPKAINGIDQYMPVQQIPSYE